jgi:hypothetical protein
VVHVLFCSTSYPHTYIHTPIMFCPVPLFYRYSFTTTIMTAIFVTIIIVSHT